MRGGAHLDILQAREVLDDDGVRLGCVGMQLRKCTQHAGQRLVVRVERVPERIRCTVERQ